MATQKRVDRDEMVAVMDCMVQEVVKGVEDALDMDIGKIDVTEYHDEIHDVIERIQRNAYVEGYAEAVRQIWELKAQKKVAYALIDILEDQLVRLRIWQESNPATSLPPFLGREIYHP